MLRLKMAVIGVGALGRHHARILAGLPHVELVAVADPREAQGREIANQFGCKWTDDYRTLLSQIDAATVVVPTSAHLEVAGDCLRRNIPVLVEKPLALTAAEGRTLVRLAAEHRVALQVGHIERFNPAFQAVEGFLAESPKQSDSQTSSRPSASPRLTLRTSPWTTTPRYIRAERYSPFPFRSLDISVVHDLMIHDIELALHLAQAPVTHVEALGSSLVGGLYDCVQARLKFANGCWADLTANRVSPVLRRTLQIWTTSGCIQADLQSREVTNYSAGSLLRAGQYPHVVAQQPGADVNRLKQEFFGSFIDVTAAEVASGDALTAELQNFVTAVSTGLAPMVTGQQGLRALEIADQVLNSIAQHAWQADSNAAVMPSVPQLPQQARAA